MARHIDPIKKAKYKRSRLKGKSIAQSLKNAGYSKATAENANSSLTCVKLCEDAIAKSFKMSELTIESVLAEISALQSRALEQKDNATATRLLEMKGRYLAMFTDKKKIETNDVTDYGKAFQAELARIDPRRKLRVSPTTDDESIFPTTNDNNSIKSGNNFGVGGGGEG